MSEGSAAPLTTIQPDGTRSVVHPLVYCPPGPRPYLDHLTEPQKQAAIRQLTKIGNMIETIAERLQIDPPLLLLPSGTQQIEFSHFPAFQDEAESNIAFTIITINPRYISDLGPLAETGQARSDLCLTDAELYGILAHELGHDVTKKTSVIDYVDPAKHDPSDAPHIAKANQIAQNKNHLDEFEADASAIYAGAQPADITRAILKITRDWREQILREGSYGKLLLQNKEQAAERPMEIRLQGRQNVTAQMISNGGHSHPSLIERNHAMNLYEQDPDHWQKIIDKHRDTIAQQEQQTPTR